MILIIAYLAAVVIANLTVAWFGPAISIVNAFLFIALDLSSRDTLHERWVKGNHFWHKMLALIATGSILSALLNTNAVPIAVASFVSFLACNLADTLTYIALGNRSILVKMNGSNLVSAAVDSVVFPLLAFGWPPLLLIMAGEFVAKVIGGAVWSVILTRNVIKPMLVEKA